VEEAFRVTEAKDGLVKIGYNPITLSIVEGAVDHGLAPAVLAAKEQVAVVVGMPRTANGGIAMVTLVVDKSVDMVVLHQATQS
jgi:hypothetical protein